jgi:hypothetical protein
MPAAQLFVDRDFSGAYADLEEGDFNITKLTERDSVGNDTVSSLKVSAGYTVIVYTDANFAGASKTFTADAAYVGDDFNDKISSVRVTATAAPRSSYGEGGQQVVFVQPPSYH